MAESERNPSSGKDDGRGGEERYGPHYYETSCGPIPYDRRQSHWAEFFGRIADRVVAEIKPSRVLDVGCAKGVLVESLRDRGVEAHGIDVSDFANGEVQPDIRPYCHVASAVEPFDGLYDLIVCIEVLEHISEPDGRRVIANICANTDDVLFSSTPDDVEEPTHINVRPESYWVAQFAAHGFAPDMGFDATFIIAHALRFRRLGLEQMRRQIAERDRQIAELSLQLLAIQRTMGWRALERLRRFRDRLFPPRSRRRWAYWVGRRVIEVLFTEGAREVLRKTTHKLRKVITQGAPLVILPPDDVMDNLNAQYQYWLERHAPTSRGLLEMKAQVQAFRSAPLISIITPVCDPPEAWLRKAIESVRVQVYSHWELCLVNDASTKPYVGQILDEYAALESRIRVKHLSEREGIAGASNQALGLATGEFVGFLDHDDELSPDALFEVVARLNQAPDVDLVYSDEDKLELDGRRVEPFFKPDWSPDLLLSMNYITHFSVFRRSVLEAVGGFRRGFDGSQDYDLLLRVTERIGRIAHVPKILYHWRKIPGSAATGVAAKPQAHEAGRRAIAEALLRRNCQASVETVKPGRYLVRRKIQSNPLVSIIIPIRDHWRLLEQCLRSIQAKTDYTPYEIIILDNDTQEPETLRYLDRLTGRCRVCRYPGPFNFAAINNFGATQAQGECLLFLNNDTEVLRAEWLSAMVEQGQRSEVGAVGAKLLFPDGRIQHAGVVLGIGGMAGHAFKGLSPEAPTYFDFAEVVRDCSAVTAACVMVRREVFEQVGGFDERLKVVFNDVDFCLRLRQRGYQIVYTPLALLYHHECASRGQLHPPEEESLMWRLWGETIKAGDPYYNPNLTLSREDWSLRL